VPVVVVSVVVVLGVVTVVVVGVLDVVVVGVVAVVVVAVDEVVLVLIVGVLLVVATGQACCASAATVAAPLAIALARRASTPDRLLAEFVRVVAALAACGQLCAASAEDREFTWSLSALA
jgi:hypothetical protein